MMLSTDHIPNGDLAQYVNEASTAPSASAIRSHVVECAPCRERLIAKVVTRLGALGKRENRVATSQPASLQSLCPLSFERIEAEVVDISKNGYGLRTTTFFEPGTIVDLRIGPNSTIATVRYCRSLRAHTFRTGVELQHA